MIKKKRNKQSEETIKNRLIKRDNRKKLKSKLQKDNLVEIKDMTYKDLKKAVVVRGMPFKDVISGDFFKLSSYLHNNFFTKINNDLLNEYDDWLDNSLSNQGASNMVHPNLRLGYIGEKECENQIKLKKVKIERKPKERREKTTEGLFKGTKKALTFQCAKEGKSLEDTISTVSSNFSDTNLKSIKIWYKKAIRDAKG